MSAKVRFDIAIRKIDDEKRLAYGEVYSPFVIDTHGDMMLPDDVQLLAHRFIANERQGMVDVMHNNVVIDAVVVESFVNGRDPDYAAGAWVAVTRIHDDDVWLGIKAGVYNGYSMEAYVKKQKAVVEMDVQNHVYGVTEAHGGHDHAYHVELDDLGKVIGGWTSADDGHSHVIRMGTATDEVNGHAHRFFLP